MRFYAIFSVNWFSLQVLIFDIFFVKFVLLVIFRNTVKGILFLLLPSRETIAVGNKTKVRNSKPR